MIKILYTKDDLTNAFISIQSVIANKVGKYSESLMQSISQKAHDCLLSADTYNLNTIRQKFLELDKEIAKVGKHSQDLKEDLEDESDVCFNIASEIAEQGEGM